VGKNTQSNSERGARKGGAVWTLSRGGCRPFGQANGSRQRKKRGTSKKTEFVFFSREEKKKKEKSDGRTWRKKERQGQTNIRTAGGEEGG